VEGRADDVLRFPGVTLHPLTLRSVFVATPEVVEYQVRQTARGVHAAVVAAGALDRSGLADRLRTALAGAGLPDPVVTVETLPAVPVDARTGKAKRFLSLAPGTAS
jgi:phenylacetate-coenzyme A ligase PaaK-like adenylate-forming protein